MCPSPHLQALHDDQPVLNARHRDKVRAVGPGPRVVGQRPAGGGGGRNAHAELLLRGHHDLGEARGSGEEISKSGEVRRKRLSICASGMSAAHSRCSPHATPYLYNPSGPDPSTRGAVLTSTGSRRLQSRSHPPAHPTPPIPVHPHPHSHRPAARAAAPQTPSPPTPRWASWPSRAPAAAASGTAG